MKQQRLIEANKKDVLQLSQDLEAFDRIKASKD